MTPGLKALAIAAGLLAGPLTASQAGAAVIDITDDVTVSALSSYWGGYNVTFSYDFGNVLEAGDTLTSWVIDIDLAHPTAVVDSGWSSAAGTFPFSKPELTFTNVSGQTPRPVAGADTVLPFSLSVRDTGSNPSAFAFDFSDYTFSLSSDQLASVPSEPSVPSAVPLPAGLPLLFGGLGVLGFIARRRRNKLA
ncbi:VPLPA-CTERM sorting domain-containing protein [Aquicoccus sp. SCR17]|nr:VPLPA-CTERM sorting domain-containing protein [Carideicomes alvinocaridis]